MLQQIDERNRDLLINISGRLVPRDEAGISPFDSAVQGGEAVWEGLRVYDGKIFKLREHLDRLRSSALALAFAEIPSAGLVILHVGPNTTPSAHQKQLQLLPAHGMPPRARSSSQIFAV